MAHTEHRPARRVLRREMAGTIGLLTDEHDFRAMLRYRSFTFDDHTAYLREMEAFLRTRAAQGGHTAVALFDPQEYVDFCADEGLDPDAATSRSRFTARLATTGPTLPYEGQPLTELVPALVGEAVRRGTQEYASALLARLGTCATCGEDLGRAAFARAAALLLRILDTAAPGSRHLVVSVTGPAGALVSVLHADTDTGGSTRLVGTEALEFTTVLALGLGARTPGGLVMRTSAPGSPDRVYGWRLRGDALQPLSAGEVFDAYCTDAESGDLISPESGVDYCQPPDLGEHDTARGHQH
ncbi:hypothetical protein JS756_26785 [Streptomyces actuosus]|uniref:Uncharacterized protein n=1 Tax=Streptomyces actuosus TaxID=1885 RepID=A0ABS2VWX2_STRAS|nr:hypothetical protein [Streptomyces actuosus]MBN0047650.1 hypothetical protein [Streptomyces actuosus]